MATELETNTAHILRRIITKRCREKGVPLTTQEAQIENFIADAQILILHTKKQ